MRYFRVVAVGVVLVVVVGSILGMACAGAQGEEGPQGPKGDTGADGVGVENIVNNGDGTFSVNLTNGEKYTTDNFTGPKGENGDKGDQGLQGIQGVQGEPGPDMIVAMGVVNYLGDLVRGYNVYSVVWNDTEAMDYYEIMLYRTYTTYYVTIVTPQWNTTPSCVYGSSGGNLRVAMWEGSGWVKCGFSFVVLTTTPSP